MENKVLTEEDIAKNSERLRHLKLKLASGLSKEEYKQAMKEYMELKNGTRTS